MIFTTATSDDIKALTEMRIAYIKDEQQGISTHLMNDLISYAKGHHLDFVELKATKEGYPLYRKIGFSEYHSEYTDMRMPL